MSTTVDARGLSCPQPVILARKAIADGAFPVEVMVDSATARDNVSRVALKAGLKVGAKTVGDEFVLTIDR